MKMIKLDLLDHAHPCSTFSILDDVCLLIFDCKNNILSHHHQHHHHLYSQAECDQGTIIDIIDTINIIIIFIPRLNVGFIYLAILSLLGPAPAIASLTLSPFKSKPNLNQI